MALVTRDAIRTKNDLKIKEVEVPEWGGSVFVRVLSARQRDEFEVFVESRKRGKSVDPRGIRVKYLILTACDDNGKPLFVDDDLEWLLDKSLSAVNRVVDAANELNGTAPDSLEDAAKN